MPSKDQFDEAFEAAFSQAAVSLKEESAAGPSHVGMGSPGKGVVEGMGTMSDGYHVDSTMIESTLGSDGGAFNLDSLRQEALGFVAEQVAGDGHGGGGDDDGRRPKYYSQASVPVRSTPGRRVGAGKEHQDPHVHGNDGAPGLPRRGNLGEMPPGSPGLHLERDV